MPVKLKLFTHVLFYYYIARQKSSCASTSTLVVTGVLLSLPLAQPSIVHRVSASCCGHAIAAGERRTSYDSAVVIKSLNYYPKETTSPF